MVELLIYLGILVVLLAMVLQITVPILKSGNVTKGQVQLRQEISFLIEKLTSETKNSFDVDLVSDWILKFKKLNKNVYIRFGQKTYLNDNNELMGFMSSFDGGSFSLNCKNFTSNCNNYRVIFNNSTQRLEGWAWSPVFGWIHFNTTTYSVNFNSSTREFYGYAWNDVFGWIKFNCDSNGNSQNCSPFKWKVAMDENRNIYGYAWNDVLGWLIFDGNNAYAFYRDGSEEFILLSRNIYFKDVKFEKVNSSIDGYFKAEFVPPLPQKPIETEIYINLLKSVLR